MIFEEIYNFYGKTDTDLNLKEDQLNVILIVGVNGVGKTTSIAKLAKMFTDQNKKVHLIAADTFRAGAVKQLEVWAERVGVSITTPQKQNQDPASVVYQGVEYAQANGIDIVLCDTAGRLQNKVNLMNELKKINTIIEKKLTFKATETLLVIDATTGQNCNWSSSKISRGY